MENHREHLAKGIYVGKDHVEDGAGNAGQQI
jgi:hypothetical protein